MYYDMTGGRKHPITCLSSVDENIPKVRPHDLSDFSEDDHVSQVLEDPSSISDEESVNGSESTTNYSPLSPSSASSGHVWGITANNRDAAETFSSLPARIISVPLHTPTRPLRPGPLTPKKFREGNGISTPNYLSDASTGAPSDGSFPLVRQVFPLLGPMTYLANPHRKKCLARPVSIKAFDHKWLAYAHQRMSARSIFASTRHILYLQLSVDEPVPRPCHSPPPLEYHKVGDRSKS